MPIPLYVRINPRVHRNVVRIVAVYAQHDAPLPLRGSSIYVRVHYLFLSSIQHYAKALYPA